MEESIEELKKNKDIDGLIEKLKERFYELRTGAIKALGEIGDKRAVKPLIEALKAKGNYEPTQKLILDALAKIGDKSAIEPLIEAHEALSKRIGRNIITTLQALGASEFDINKLKLLQQKREEKPDAWITIVAVLASLLCFIAGIWMLSIESEATEAGEQGTIFESAIHAIGLYFIGKSFFIGPVLYLLGKRRAS